MNILYCVIHTKKQSDRHESIIKTWGKNKEIIFYSDHEDMSRNIFKVSDRSDYCSGEEKQINIIDFLINNKTYSNYDWYFFCDNDTFVNTNHCVELIKNFSINKVHGLVLSGTYPADRSLNYCSGGAGFLINKHIMDKLYGNVRVHNSGWGDVSLGLCLRELGISCENHSCFHAFPPKNYNYNLETIKEQLTFHYITSMTAMQSLYFYTNLSHQLKFL